MTELIDFVVRADSRTKRGGDDAQVQRYVDGLTTAGFSTTVIPFGPGMVLRPDSIVHVINVDRPFELLETARIAGGRRLVVSPIHHDPRGVRAMRSAERGRGLRSTVDRLLPETPRELLAALVRTRSSPHRGSWRVYARFAGRSTAAAPQVWKRAGRLLDGAAAVALLARGEGRLLRDRTGWSAANDVLTPNGAPVRQVEGGEWNGRSRDVVMVGRVEPRKRQLEVIRAAARRGLRLTVVGALQSPDSRFGREFLAAVASSGGVVYLGALDAEKTLRVIRDAKVLLNASWVEVQSLVDLEASALGCHVVATPAGHSQEWLGDSVSTTDDLSDLESLLDLAEARLAGGEPPPPHTYPHTWAASVETLAQAYRSPGPTR